MITHTHNNTMEHYAAIKRNIILLFTTTWMDLEGTAKLNKSGRWRWIPYCFTYIWNLKTKQRKQKQTKKKQRKNIVNREEKMRSWVKRERGIKSILWCLHWDIWLLKFVEWSHCKIQKCNVWKCTILHIWN